MKYSIADIAGTVHSSSLRIIHLFGHRYIISSTQLLTATSIMLKDVLYVTPYMTAEPAAFFRG